MLHESFLRHCLTLAERARGKTGINPMVGAVLVREGRIIAEGWHHEFGAAHAERSLLESCTGDIRPTDTLYVNLEPCCHTQKKTPPCSELLIERGIRNVVYGMRDPNPEVSGRGIALLNKNSIQTFGPTLEQECKRLNRGFVSLMTRGRPWITLKSAITADGRFAHHDGSSLKITSTDQDAWSHQFLRARHDAILVGIGTVIADDPQLTVRHPSTRAGEANEGRIHRIILDPLLKIPIDARVVTTGTVIVTGEAVQNARLAAVQAAGLRVMRVPMVNGVFSWDALWNVLTMPDGDFYGISSILVEGGPKTWELFRAARMVDEEVTLAG